MVAMKSSHRPWVALALLASLAAPAPLRARVLPRAGTTAAVSCGKDEETEKLLARARAACGIESFRAQAKGRELLLRGTSQRFGVAGDWSLRLAADGRFVREIAVELHERDGFDGREAWHVDQNGIPFVANLSHREHLALV